MRYCRFSKDGKIGRICTLTFYPAVTLILLVLEIIGATNAIVAYINCPNNMSEVIMVITVFIIVNTIWLYFFIAQFCLENRMFSVSEEGLILQYPHQKSKIYRWNEIEEIAISAFNAPASRNEYQTVICCFIAKRPPKFKDKIVRGYFYGANNVKNVAIIDYSESVIEELSCYYPNRIIDYRPIQFRTF